MAVYKEPKTNTWRVIYRYTDWNGERKQSQKRGFQTKREAQSWEREQLNKLGSDLDMTFRSFVEHYEEDRRSRIKDSTWESKEHIIRTKLLPYFGKLKMSSITPQQIVWWQNELINYRDKDGAPYSPVYLKSIQNQISAIFNHAVRYYNLKENSRKFKAENVDGSRTHLNIDYCNERIQTVYDKHLSVLDYKKQEREKEIAALDTTLTEKQDELETVQNRIDNFDQGAHSIERLEQRIESDAEFQLPDPPTLMTAKTYKQRFVDPLIKKLKEVIREVFYHYYKALDSYHRLNTTNGRLYRENEHLTIVNDKLKGENEVLRSELKDFRFLRKVLGSRQIDNLIAQAKDMEQQRKQNQRTSRRNTNYER